MSNLKQTNTILVTGAEGFVGKKLIPALVSLGFKVISFSRKDGDLTQLGVIEEKVQNRVVDAVIHCASLRPRTHVDFDAYYRGNILTLCRVLDWMKQRGVKNGITFSSVTAYGDTHGILLTEDTQVNPIDDYALSKLVADQLLKYRSQSDGLHCVNFRLPPVFGPGKGGGVIETYYEHAIRNQDIEIFSKGKLWRNLIHVDQVIQACHLALEKMNELKGYNLFLLGSSNSLTMESIVRHLVDKMHSKSNIILIDRRAPTHADWLLNLNRVKEVLGFKPVSLEDSLDWYVEQQSA